MEDELVEPLTPDEARRLIKTIIAEGVVTFRVHAKARLAERSMDSVDVVNVLRAGVVQEPEMEDGTWRYRVCTMRMTVVVAFRSKTELVVVTAWRNERGLPG
jgi:hypothetical protein